MNQKIFFFLLFFLPCAFATQTISDVHVKDSVPLGENVTVNGIYIDSDSNNQTLCSAEVRNDLNVSIIRLTDQYTFGNQFFFEQQISEPVFQRENDYNLVVTCGKAQTIQQFSVAQRRTFVAAGIEEWKFFWEHSKFIMIMGTALIVFAGIIYLIWRTVTGN